MNQKKPVWLCLECGRKVYFPSVNEERTVVCTHCRKPDLVEIPQEQISAQAVTA